MVETTLWNILKLENDVAIAEIKKNLFATNIKKIFILIKASLKVIKRQVSLLLSDPGIKL